MKTSHQCIINLCERKDDGTIVVDSFYSRRECAHALSKTYSITETKLKKAFSDGQRFLELTDGRYLYQTSIQSPFRSKQVEASHHKAKIRSLRKKAARKRYRKSSPRERGECRPHDGLTSLENGNWKAIKIIPSGHY